MVAEAVSFRPFREALAALDDGKQIEVDFAIYAIEDDPSWGLRNRMLASADSGYSGFIADLSVDGWAIIYRIEDQGAAVELWWLVELPGWRAERDPGGFAWM